VAPGPAAVDVGVGVAAREGVDAGVDGATDGVGVVGVELLGGLLLATIDGVLVADTGVDGDTGAAAVAAGAAEVLAGVVGRPVA
jgi:hypothetical protein